MNHTELKAVLEPIVDELIGLEKRVDGLASGQVPTLLVKRLEGSKAILRSWAADFVHRAPQQVSAGVLPPYIKSVVGQR